MITEVTLDAREMAPPEPFDQATAILRKLEPGEYLLMLHRRVPFPLFDFCTTLSLRYRYRELAPGDYEIVVYHAADEMRMFGEGILCE